jgi:formiminotetrahydrofolate cyclodeaminase
MEESPAHDRFADLTLARFVERLSTAEPVPGGGAASAVAAALGASLISMVAALSRGKPKYEAYETTLARCQAVGQELAAEFLRLADLDATAYAGYSAALKLPRETEAQQEARRTAIQNAVVAAEALAGRSNVNAASDVLVAALLGEAAARGAAENVLINLPSTGDESYSESMRWQVDALLHEVAAGAARTREFVLSGQSRDPEEA